MKEVEVSVILLCYNQRNTVGRAIDSVLAQNVNFPIEIVIGDDASSDGTREVCERYALKYPDIIRLLPAAPNKGVVRNYFEALSVCRGRFIADCAGDDYWIGPDTLRHKYDMLSSDPSAVFVHTPWCENSRETVVRPSVKETEQDIMESILAHENPMPVHLSTVLYRAVAARDALSGTPSVVCNPEFGCEDMPLLCALLMRGHALYLDEPSLMYVRKEGSVSNAGVSVREAEFHLKTALATKVLSRYYGVYSSRVRAAVAKKIGYAMACAVACKDRAMRRQILSAVSSGKVPVTFRYRVLKIISATPWGWRLYGLLRSKNQR